ncbi:MAG: hypothetical protein R3C04_07550 [Hyphomonas sp.]
MSGLWFRNFVTILIIFNAIILGVLTYRGAPPHGLVSGLEVIDQAVTWVFAVEIPDQACGVQAGLLQVRLELV